MTSFNQSSAHTIKTWNALAAVYAEKFSGLTYYDESYRYFFDKLPNGAKVLEIGSGPGIIADFVSRMYPHIQMLITDAAEEMVLLSQQRFPQYKHLCLKAEEVSSLEGKYDGVVSAFCIPYLSAPSTQKFIHDTYDKLSSKGLFYLSFMEDDYAASGLQKGSTGHEMMVYYYAKHQIAAWLQEAGFELIHQFGIPPGDLTAKSQCMWIAKKVE